MQNSGGGLSLEGDQFGSAAFDKSRIETVETFSKMIQVKAWVPSMEPISQLYAA